MLETLISPRMARLGQAMQTKMNGIATDPAQRLRTGGNSIVARPRILTAPQRNQWRVSTWQIKKHSQRLSTIVYSPRQHLTMAGANHRNWQGRLHTCYQPRSPGHLPGQEHP